MYKEYAVEPSAIGQSWEVFRYLIEKFDFEEGRLISRFPRKWERMVLEAAKAEDVPNAAFLKIVEKLRRKKDSALLKAGREYDPSKPGWIENALASHQERPFEGIIVRREIEDGQAILVDDVDDDHPLLVRARSADVPRTAAGISEACSTLLASSNSVDLVDPFFDLRPNQGNYLDPLSLMLNKFSAGRENLIVRVHYRDHQSRPPEQILLQSSGVWTQGIIPAGVELHLIAWAEKPGGEDFHDRFVLTELGGLQVGAGLAATNQNENATVTILDTVHAGQIRAKFSDGSNAFDRVGNIVCISSDGTTRTL